MRRYQPNDAPEQLDSFEHKVYDVYVWDPPLETTDAEADVDTWHEGYRLRFSEIPKYEQAMTYMQRLAMVYRNVIIVRRVREETVTLAFITKGGMP